MMAAPRGIVLLRTFPKSAIRYGESIQSRNISANSSERELWCVEGDAKENGSAKGNRTPITGMRILRPNR